MIFIGTMARPCDQPTISVMHRVGEHPVFDMPRSKFKALTGQKIFKEPGIVTQFFPKIIGGLACLENADQHEQPIF